jgi:hypothetical protein
MKVSKKCSTERTPITSRAQHTALRSKRWIGMKYNIYSITFPSPPTFFYFLLPPLGELVHTFGA